MQSCSRTQAMIRTLARATEHPASGGVFYSADGAKTASPTLNADPSWDWTPTQTARAAGTSTCMFPLTLGCEPWLFDDGKEWLHPRFSDPAQIADFEPPDVHSGRTGEVLATIRTLAESLPPGQLIRDPDTQSPLGVAELMWDDSFYLAITDHPGEVHALIDKITDFIIEFIREVHVAAQGRLNPCGFPPIWAEGPGTMIADDSMSLVSPAMHREFSIPYLNRIADVVGPVWYHSCTWREQYFANLRDLRNVVAWNWNPGNSCDPAVVMKEFGGTAVLTPHIVADMHRDNDLLHFGFADEVDLVRYILDHKPKDTVLYFWLSNVTQKREAIEGIYALMDERGHSPRAVLCE
ncbi:MAG: uroporphyrinogen decarboxylase family protein [Candidatus Pacebacteria bacterium]|nr:uroporphyrinogen decarboxylase family protein [Candidatus Paceibacterota bacterium]